MNVDVLYDGLVVQRGATARDEAGGAFVELEQPLPVGTRLLVRGPEGERSARVTRVHEGLGSGVLVQFGDARPLGEAGSARTASQVPQHSAPAAPAASGSPPAAPVASGPPPAAPVASGPPPAPAPAEAAEPADAATEPADADEASAKPEDKPDDPNGNGKRRGRDRRRGRSKTVIGH